MPWVLRMACSEAHDDVVEEAVVEAGEALFHVDLDHVDAVAGAGDDALGVVLDAVAAHLAHSLRWRSRLPSPQPRSSTRSPGSIQLAITS
jgi:hypothetical protein